eukprot:gb/GECG01012412.1/.p1 GENE.gb/GECG01012412.1/~~gb/GECG01012412.1/.p1  ORF type:complete len:482 (+),score=49.54 gb/GECG01012412.1/:1-1446(+)
MLDQMNSGDYSTSSSADSAASATSATERVSSDGEDPAGNNESLGSSRLSSKEEEILELRLANKVPHNHPRNSANGNTLENTGDRGGTSGSRSGNAPTQDTTSSATVTGENGTEYYRQITATTVDGPSPVGIVEVPLSDIFSSVVQQKAKTKYPDAWNVVAESKRRSGKWTDYEIDFASQLISLFRVGLIRNLKPNTTLRAYVATALNCDPMRVSKKWPKEAALGKQVYVPKKDPNPPFASLEEEIAQAEHELDDMCLEFLEKFQDDLEDTNSRTPQHIRAPLTGKRRRSFDVAESEISDNPASPTETYTPRSQSGPQTQTAHQVSLQGSSVGSGNVNAMPLVGQFWSSYQQMNCLPQHQMSPHIPIAPVVVSSSSLGAGTYFNPIPVGPNGQVLNPSAYSTQNYISGSHFQRNMGPIIPLHQQRPHYPYANQDQPCVNSPPMLVAETQSAAASSSPSGMYPEAANSRRNAAANALYSLMRR